MRKIFRVFFFTILSLIGLLLLVGAAVMLTVSISRGKIARESEALSYPEVQSITIDNFTFRDLNKNGRLDIYEDSRQKTESRVKDLLSQMNLEEKAGVMFVSPVGIKKDGSIVEKPYLSNPLSLYVPGTWISKRKKKQKFFRL